MMQREHEIQMHSTPYGQQRTDQYNCCKQYYNRRYSYRQIITRPILGGGFMTALAVPLIGRFGLPAFTIAAAAATGVLIAWGIKRVGRQG